jgi:hypothetical protein
MFKLRSRAHVFVIRVEHENELYFDIRVLLTHILHHRSNRENRRFLNIRFSPKN